MINISSLPFKKIIVIRARTVGDFCLRLQGRPGHWTGIYAVISKRRVKGACSRAKRNGVPDANRKRLEVIFHEAFSLKLNDFDEGGAS